MGTIVYLTTEAVLRIHRRLIEKFGGEAGLRDLGLLESAVAMAQASFGGEDLHPGLAQKAAAYHFHLCANHPFVDGNKRVAVAAAEVFLLLNEHEVVGSDEEFETLTLGVASGLLSKEAVTAFFDRSVVARGD